MTKALLAAFVLVGSAFFVGCAAEAPTVQTTKSSDRSASDETKPSSSSSSSKSDPTDDTSTTTATTDRAAPSEATTPATAPVAPKDVDVKPIDPAKPVAPVIPAFACKTDEDSVTASYKIALLRAPDQDGLSYWVLQVQGGQSRLEVLRNMVRSDEFTKSRSVLSDEQFVNSLYTGFLARQPDEDGKAFWLNALASGGSRTDVALSFVNSDEFADPTSNKQASCYF